MIHKLLKRPQAIIGLCLIAIVIVIAIAAPAFSPHDPELVNLSQKYAQPDAEYPIKAAVWSQIFHRNQFTCAADFVCDWSDCRYF